MPKAARVLQDLHGVPTFEDSYAARHPFAAYNISLTAIARRVISVVEYLAEVQREPRVADHGRSQSDEQLLEATDHLLDSLMEHMDVCNGILRSFYPPAEDTKFKKALTAFKVAVEPYRKHIGTIDNYIKHSQGRLRLIRFQWATGSCVGYFVEGPVAAGVLGPVGVVHPEKNSAFSFNRDIPFHVCNVFAVGARLASALHEVDRRLVVLPLAKSVEGRDSDWSKAIRATASLPSIFFPDELQKKAPKVHVTENKVLIEYPAAHPRLIGPPNKSQISLNWGGDGVTKSFRLPYFNENG